MCFLKRLSLFLVTAFMMTNPSAAQSNGGRPQNSTDEIQQLRASLAGTKSELQQCKAEIEQLRTELRAVQKQIGMSTTTGESSSSVAAFPTLADISRNPPASAKTSSHDDLLAAKVTELEQTKVESASKYKVRLSGLILMNAYTNLGAVDSTDLPMRAFSGTPGGNEGNIGATFRQTTLGLQVFGPELAGARTSAEVQTDFFGGIPQTHYGVTMGAVRMRTANLRLDWPKWTVSAGQDAPFFAPLSPTSYATLAEPAFSWSGNLWVWTPQVRVERRWARKDDSNVALTFGVLDPLTETTPESSFNRHADPGEASRVPGLATHVAWNRNQATVGIGGYFGRQNWGFGKDIASWVVSGDFLIPFSRFELSGELYRGQAVGGFGGGIWTSALFDGDPDTPGTNIIPLNDVGGWAQFKIKADSRLQFNFAAGAANPFARDLEHFAQPRTYSSIPLARNQTFLVNSIFTPRSNLLLGLEYRRLRTYTLSGKPNTADHVNLSVGVSF